MTARIACGAMIEGTAKGARQVDRSSHPIGRLVAVASRLWQLRDMPRRVLGQRRDTPDNGRLERAMGIEPTAQAWEAWVLPLYDARAGGILCARPRLVQINRPGRRPSPCGTPRTRAGAAGGLPAGVDQLTRAMTKGLRPVVTVGALSGVSDPSAPMANCDTVLSLTFVT